MLHYILQTIIFQLLFLMVYDVFLKKETFFNWNRFYLLASAFLSVVLPFVKVDRFKEIIPQDYIFALPGVIIGKAEEIAVNTETLTANESVSAFVFNWHYIIYFGCAIALIFFIIKLSNLLVLAYKNPKTKLGNTLLVELLNSTSAFSFFNFIFLGSDIKADEKKVILAHELEHVRQKHSIDLLFFEVLRILFWFNPLIYRYQNRIANLHEFIADSKAIKTNSKKSYYENLLSQVFDTKKVSFINPFFKESLIKKRIIMLSKNKSKQINLVKYVLLVPMVLGMLFYTSCDSQVDSPDLEVENIKQYSYSLEKNEVMSDEKKVIHNKYEDFLKQNNIDYVSWASADKETGMITYSIHKSNENVPDSFRELEVIFKDGASYITYIEFPSPNNEFKDEIVKESLDSVNVNTYNTSSFDEETISFATIDQVPIYPGCDGSEDEKACMSRNINKFVAQNFNLDLGKALGLIGKQKIQVFFTIDKTGNIVNIKTRAPHPALEKETRRVVGMLPKFKAGEQEGKPANVTFFLPITFNVAE